MARVCIASFSHIQLNVIDQNQSRDFYRIALAPMGFVVADEQPGEFVRLTNGRDAVIVLCQADVRFRDRSYHRKAVGLSHFALCVPSRSDVDVMHEHLSNLSIDLFGDGKVETGYRRGYYCLLFEDPNRIMVEIVHHDSYYFSRDLNPLWR